MFLLIFALLIAVLPVYCVLAGFVELTRRHDLRRGITDAFTASAAALTASMRLRRHNAAS